MKIKTITSYLRKYMYAIFNPVTTITWFMLRAHVGVTVSKILEEETRYVIGDKFNLVIKG